MNIVQFIDGQITNNRYRSKYAIDSVSENTKRSYFSDLSHYMNSGGIFPATEDMIVKYIEDHARDLKPTTLTRRLNAIKWFHIKMKEPDPTQESKVIDSIKGIRRNFGKPPKKANPFMPEHKEIIYTMLKKYNKLSDCRNLAIIMVGIGLALRCSEITNLRFEHLNFVEKGVEIFIPYSKTDQENKGVKKGINYSDSDICAVKCLKEWLHKSNISSGYVFRAVNKQGKVLSNKMNNCTIDLIVKQVASDADFPDSERFSGHSLRRGFVTIGVLKGVPLPNLASHGRWEDIGTMMGYYGENNIFNHNPTSTIFSDRSYL